MLVPYSWLKDFLPLKKPAEEVAKDLSSAVIGVKEVQSDNKDKVLNLDVTYNRGDLLSIIGVARELSALYKLNFKGEEEKFQPGTEVETLSVKSRENLSRYYTLTKISNLTYRGTPELIKRRLESSGVRSINLWVDLANYVMLEYGQPFHAFDLEKVARRDPTLSLEVRNAKDGETIKTLEGLDHRFTSGDIVIADKFGPIAIAGIMGSKDTEVDEGTKEILLEAAIFDPVSIRKTARRLGSRSEASNRFEHFLSSENLLRALNKATQLYTQWGQGKVAGFAALGSGKVEAAPVVLAYEKLTKVAGVPLPLPKAREYLELLGFKVMNSEKGLLAWPPDFRGDIKNPEDLAEEVLRIYGYENIPPLPLQTTLGETGGNTLRFWRNSLTDFLADLGFHEVKTYPFVTTKILPHLEAKHLWRITNPVSTDAEYLRPNLLFSLLQAAQQNAGTDLEGKIFELEKAYPKDGEAFHLAALSWGEKENFLALKGVFEAIAQKAHLSIEFNKTKNNFLHPVKSAEVKVGKISLGYLGEVHPHLAEAFKLNRAVVFELDFEKLVYQARRWGTLRPVSQYQQVSEDFSFVVTERQSLGDLIKKIKEVSDLIWEVRIVEHHRKMQDRFLTLRVVFQPMEKNLSASDILPLREKVKSVIKGKGTLRT